MQWVALDEHRPVIASQAVKKKKYLCPECSAIVQLRGGPHRQTHFYHLHSSRHCHQNKKTEEHLGLQIFLASSMPSGEMHIERPFLQIKRIADVAWETRKIIFEIQCSPISLEEVQKRCEDYHSLGWKLIWVLSDKTFNQKKMSAAEAFLRHRTCYFSHWETRKIGIRNAKNQKWDKKTTQLKTDSFLRSCIYDQCEILKGFRRLYHGFQVPINPLLITDHFPHPMPPYSLPASLQTRWNCWELKAEGDILSKILCTPPHFIQTLLSIENRYLDTQSKNPHLPWPTLFKKSYLYLFNHILRLLTRD